MLFPFRIGGEHSERAVDLSCSGVQEALQTFQPSLSQQAFPPPLPR